MKLTYRGISYDYTPANVATAESVAVGKYRGLEWRFRNPKKPLILQTNLDLKYRGVASKPAEPVVKAAPALSVQDKARTLMMDRTISQQKRQHNLLMRSQSEVGLAH
ncbi:MAG: DUF4278 domain-containing protein [Coleofasciculaceae cyanobacterium SM2_3_26]|nr:DUF4278 domain-containing protein [Coleofasciculaceae cyanobacterium SM2_3_26]